MSEKDEKPRSFTKVERKILEAVKNGEAADFTADANDGEKPVVSAKFLADLWLERFTNVDIHPLGIEIKGLKVEGQLTLGGARQSAKGKQCLLGFHAENCEFISAISLQNVRCESIYLTDCQIGLFANDDGIEISIDGSGATIDGQLSLTRCTATGVVTFDASEIGGKADFEDCQFCQGLSFWGATVRNHFRIGRSTAGIEFNGHSLSLPNAKIGGQVVLTDSRFAAPVYAANLVSPEIFVDRCRFSGDHAVSLSFAHARIGGNLVVFRSRASGAFNFGSMHLGGTCDVSQTQILAGLNLTDSIITAGIAVKKCLLSGHSTIWACTLSGTETSTIEFTQVAIAGHFSLQAARTSGAIGFDRVNFGWRRPYLSLGPNQIHRLDFGGLETRNRMIFTRCAFRSSNVMRGMAVGVDLGFEDCYFSPCVDLWSVMLAGSKIGSIAEFKRCLIGNGVEMPTFDCSELQFHGNWIYPAHDTNGRYVQAVWASDCNVLRRIGFGKAEDNRADSGENICIGKIDFSNSKVGERLFLRSLRIRLGDGSQPGRRGRCIDLSRMEVGGDLFLAPHTYTLFEEEGKNDEPAHIEGCVDLDDARIGGDLIVHRTSIHADGDIVRPLSHFETEERVSKRKRGVAISLRDTRIEGELEFGRPQIRGLIDLRDASVGAITDGGGDRWVEHGVEPGHLLLDGLTYRDLDNVHDGLQAGLLEQGSLSDAATRRLDWLTMQYPGRKPTPDTFVPQPYEQLASIFAAEGNERARRQVLVEKRNLQRKHGRLGIFDRAVQWLLMGVSLYGYSPARALGWTLAYLALGTFAAMALETRDAFILATIDGQPKAEFSALVYAIDSAIPIIDLNQDSGWTIDPGSLPGWLSIEVVLGLKAAYEIVGMLLISITILTLTGTLRDKE